MQSDNHKIQPVRAYYRSKWSLLSIVILYFIAGQVYPYFHIHHHDPHQQTEIDLCLHPSDREHHIHQCCEQHHACQTNISGDWQFVPFNIKDVKKPAHEFFQIKAASDNYNSKITVSIFDYPCTQKTFQATSKLFNKAPPVLI